MADTYTMAGTSVKNGVKSNRFANSTAAARRKILEKDNHSDIQLFDLPNAMTKEDALAWLAANGTTIVAAPPSTSTPAAPKAPKVATPTRESTETKTSTPAKTFNMTADQLKAAETKVTRAIREAGKNEMEVTPEIEAEAQRLHKLSVVEFLTWSDLDTELRNEFRATALHAPITKAA